MDNYFKCINFGKVKCIVCDHLSYVQILVPLVEHLTGDSMNLGSNHILVSHDFPHPITFGAVANPWNRQVYSFQRKKTCDVDLQDHLKGGRKVMVRLVWTSGTRLGQLAEHLTSPDLVSNISLPFIFEKCRYSVNEMTT